MGSEFDDHQTKKKTDELAPSKFSTLLNCETCNDSTIAWDGLHMHALIWPSMVSLGIRAAHRWMDVAVLCALSASDSSCNGPYCGPVVLWDTKSTLGRVNDVMLIFRATLRSRMSKGKCEELDATALRVDLSRDPRAIVQV
jgi:hypothetical protein